MSFPLVVKRNGDRLPFDKVRIEKAIVKAASATGEFNGRTSGAITERVCQCIVNSGRFVNEITVEQIQDLVEMSLISSEYFKTARAYIVYREKRATVRQTRSVAVEVSKTIDEYLSRSDWRVKANANQDYSLGGMILNTAGKIIANYWLNYVYPQEIREAHKSGDMHIHDLDMFSGYCAGWSLRQLLQEGFNGVPGKVESKPPKHLETAVAQMVNFLGTLQNEWAGAQAFSSVDTYLAPFVRLEELDYPRVKQCFQQLVFNLNVPSRWGTQTPFTNVTFDWVCPKDLRDKKPIIGGQVMDFTYGELQREMDMINRAFIEVMTEGDSKGRIFTFPIPTYNITEDFDWDSENSRKLFEMTAKYGTPYFQNFINSPLNPSDVRSMCCRLQLDLRELRSRGGGLFGSAEMTGSVGVVTINLARLGYLAETKDDFFNRLRKLMDLAKSSLEIKRKVITDNYEKGLLPFTKRYLYSLRNHFSTIGLNGGNEACLNLLGSDIASPEGEKFGKEVLNFMRDRIADYQEETGNLYNLEATPAEGATYRFAREDKKRFPGIHQAGCADSPYYTNSTQLPVGYTDDPISALQHQNGMQTLYTGGTVFHIFLGERISSWKSCRSLVKKVANNFRLPYFTVTPTFSICPSHGYLPGEVFNCPHCNAECEVWSRVMGYHRPVRQWNKGKQEEYQERKVFAVQS